MKQPRESGVPSFGACHRQPARDNVEEFRDKKGHKALKEVQAKSGVCCDPETPVLDLGSLGRYEIERKCRGRSPRRDGGDEFQFFDGDHCVYIG